MANDMDFKGVKDAVDGVKKLFEQYKDANDDRLKQLEAKGATDAVTEEKLAKIDAELDKQQKTLDDFVLAQKRQSRVVTDADGNTIDLDAKALAWAQMNAKRKGTAISEYGAAEMGEYKAAFDRFLRKDERTLSADEVKALSVGSDVDGGYVVHPDMSGRVVQRVFETSPMRAYASVQVISTDALEGLYDLNEASAGWVAETEARSETNTPEIGTWRIPVHELYAAPRATQKLLDDAAIDMESWLSAKVADKFARSEAAAFCTGSGVGRPRGFLTYDDWTTAGTFENGKIEQFDTGVNGAFAAAPAGGDVLINALYGLKAQYRANATWFLNRSTLKMVRKLKDSDGAYLWQPGIAAGQPATILGYPTASFEDMPDPATGSLSIAVGDMRATYQIVDRMGIRVLRDPYSAKPYVILYSVKRVGGDVVCFESLKLVKFSA